MIMYMCDIDSLVCKPFDKEIIYNVFDIFEGLLTISSKHINFKVVSFHGY